MEKDCEDIISVKAVLDCECKRFGVSARSTFSDFVSTLSSIFACQIADIQYRDGDNDLVSIGSDDEFVLALQCIAKTGGILRVVLSANVDEEVNMKCCAEPPCHDTNDSVNEMSISMEHDKEPEVELNCTDDKDSKVTSGENRKSSIRHKFESASQLSKELNFISSEVTGRIPVLAPSSVGNLVTHFTSQKPGARKVRRVSSGTTSGGTDKTEKKQSRGRQTQRKKKRKHRDSSSSSSDSSRSRSSTSSSSSSSDSSCEENYHYYKKSSKKKRKSSPTVSIEKILHKCEKHITAKVSKDMDKYTQNFKEDIITAVTNSILQKLDGAVLQSFVVPNVTTTQVSEGNVTTPQVSEGNVAVNSCKPAEWTTTKRMKYQHQNVVCDHCENEIFGPRYKCGNCSDYDLCEQCEAIEGLHTPSHVFMKMHFPAVHAGRRSVGGKSRPLLRANIYEEREEEREMEDLLRRKLDSGSELNQIVMEKFEKRRTKMKEDAHAKEACDSRREEWKKMKKEIKKNKKELAKKCKQQGKLIQRNMARGVNKDEALLGKEGFRFDVDSISKIEHHIVKEPDFMEASTVQLQSTAHDDKLSSALSTLQIAKDGGVVVKEESDDNGSACDEVIIDLTTDLATDSDDIVVVDRELGSLNLELDAVCCGVEMLQKPDLVDFNREIGDGTNSEDFVVVSNYFDLSVPIDDHHLVEHRNCSCHKNCTPDFIHAQFPERSTVTATTNQLPMDLVASVPVTARHQPDIASMSSVNIMDQSIESFSSASSSPPISPQPLSVSLSDEMLLEINSTDALHQPSEELKYRCTTPLNENNISETVVTSNETLLIQAGPSEMISREPVVELPCDENRNKGINAEGNDVGVGGGSIPVQRTQSNGTPRQGSVDFNNPIIQSQIERERSIQSNECSLRTESCNSLESVTQEVCDTQEGDGGVCEELVPPSVTAPPDAADAAASHSKTSGFGGALVGAMATIVDTVAQVVQSAKGSPKAEYRNGEVEVTIPGDPRVEGMKQLLDMGFFDRPVNERLLITHNYDVGQCVADLLAKNDSRWFDTRH